MGEALLTLAKAVSTIPELTKEIYGDLAKPGVQQFGKALGGVLGLGNTALYPVHLLNECTSLNLKKNLEQYRQKIEEIPDADINNVVPEIGVPIAEKLAYVSNAELADMYTSLLAKASSKINADQAHPGFVDIINRLCPDEAILLQKFKGKSSIPLVEVRIAYKNNTWNTLKDLALSSDFYTGLQQPNNVPAFLANLNALGIIEIRRGTFCVPKESIYPPIENFHKIAFSNLSQAILGEGRITCENFQFKITLIGTLFLQACFAPLKKK